jgi:hypothetical protein
MLCEMVCHVTIPYVSLFVEKTKDHAICSNCCAIRDDVDVNGLISGYYVMAGNYVRGSFK